MSTKITSPIKGYSERSTVGGITLDFKDGVAEHDGDLPDGIRAYLERTGYGIDGDPADPPAAPEPADPREAGDVQIGTRLRDAAVDPAPGDFLAPTNAGEANPHGPQVVNPELHASEGVRPVKPGDVHADSTDTQNAAELQHTATATDGTPLPDGQAQADTPTGDDKPAGNASEDEWRAYALAHGKTEDDLADLGRNGIRDLFA